MIVVVRYTLQKNLNLKMIKIIIYFFYLKFLLFTKK